MQKLIILIFVLSFSGCSLRADDSIKTWHLSMNAFSPFFAYYQIDVKKAISQKQRISLAPKFYYFTEGDYLIPQNIENLKGGGFDSFYEYIYRTNKDSRLFFGFGLSYNYLKISSLNVGWEEQNNGEYTYLAFVEKLIHNDISQIGLKVKLANQIHIASIFWLEMYGGFGVQYSIANTQNQLEQFDDTWFGYAYTGIYPFVGLKLGIELGKKK